MNRKSLFLAVAVLAAVAQVGLANYSYISQNLIGTGGEDTYLNNGHFWIGGTTTGAKYTLADSPALTGTKGNGTFTLDTYLQHLDYDNNPATNDALFTGGELWFNFTYDGQPYKIGGAISGMVLTYTYLGSNKGRIDGEGEWFTSAQTVLPGSNVWTPVGAKSTIRSLTLLVGNGLEVLNWSGNYGYTSLDTTAESQYTLYPGGTAAPEPATLALLAGGLVLIRRRRA